MKALRVKALAFGYLFLRPTDAYSYFYSPVVYVYLTQDFKDKDERMGLYVADHLVDWIH